MFFSCISSLQPTEAADSISLRSPKRDHARSKKNALDTAQKLDVPVPLANGVMEVMQTLKADGKAGDDHGGIIQYYEKLAKIEVRRKK